MKGPQMSKGDSAAGVPRFTLSPPVGPADSDADPRPRTTATFTLARRGAAAPTASGRITLARSEKARPAEQVGNQPPIDPFLLRRRQHLGRRLESRTMK